MQPVIKYSGSKRPVAKEIAALFPKKEGARFFDPFVGGGAILPYRPCARAMAGDIIPELIDAWKLIKIDPESVAEEYRQRWNVLKDGKDLVYYRIRRRFNRTRDAHDFIFLTRTCALGVIRFNAQGNFNTALHPGRDGVNPITFHLIAHQWSDVLSGVTFRHVDYRETLQYVRSGDCVFLDPPYFNTKGQYMAGTFELEPFLSELARLNSVGAHWIFTYDGNDGRRLVPKDLYRMRYKLHTGKSTLRRVVAGRDVAICESLYTNIPL